MQHDQIEGTLPRSEGAAERRFERRQLTTEQQRQVEQLSQIDRKVREHEAAHLRAGRGVVTSGANFSYTYGPDGKQYAVAGEVGIDTSPEHKPQANIDKGIRIQAAALAPRDPSSQDYRVASIGGRLEAQGRSDLAAEQREEQALRAEDARARREQERQAAESEAQAARAQTSAAQEEDSTAGEADSTRQRLAQTYGSVAARSTTVSVFA